VFVNQLDVREGGKKSKIENITYDVLLGLIHPGQRMSAESILPYQRCIHACVIRGGSGRRSASYLLI
jgi:hypothetical protein